MRLAGQPLAAEERVSPQAPFIECLPCSTQLEDRVGHALEQSHPKRRSLLTLAKETKIEAPRQQGSISGKGKEEARKIETKRPLPPGPTTARKKGEGNRKRKEVYADYDFGSDTDEALALIKIGAESLRRANASSPQSSNLAYNLPRCSPQHGAAGALRVAG